jgi:hypothetical protein
MVRRQVGQVELGKMAARLIASATSTRQRLGIGHQRSTLASVACASVHQSPLSCGRLDAVGTAPSFGDRVRIARSDETTKGGFAGRSGQVYGESMPSSSGVGPVIGDRGEDLALSVFFDDTNEQVWFAPHLVEFLEHGGVQTMSFDGGPSFVRNPDGVWHEVGGTTEVGEVLNPGGGLGRAVPDAAGRVRRWLRRRA